MKAIFLFAAFLSGILFLTQWHSCEGVIYYVKPSSASPAFKCPSQPCNTLQYYFTNSKKMINQQTNVTMFLLNGSHMIDIVFVSITAPSVKMIGESRNMALLKCAFFMCMVAFSNFNSLHIENLAIVRWTLDVGGSTLKSLVLLPPKLEMMSVSLSQSEIKLHDTIQGYIENTDMETCHLEVVTLDPSLIFNRCTFHNGHASIFGVTEVTIKDCNLFDNLVNVMVSTLILSGDSNVTATSFASAVLIYLGNITVLDTVSFVNNTGIRGGALALYSSSLNIGSSSNVTFINNSALEVGGAIYIDPSVTRNLVIKENNADDFLPMCFYQLLDCSGSATYSFYFAYNSAANGGDDIYGGTLQTVCKVGDCDLNVTTVQSGVSSVSSDPTRVCLCSHGEPQWDDNWYIFRKAYPGETFTISAVVVGGDFGPTVGVVHTKFLLSGSDYFSEPSLKPSSQYSQVVNSVYCTELSYSLHSNDPQPSVVMYLIAGYMDTQVVKSYHDDIITNHHCGPLDYCSYATPVFINITVLPCPPGFTLLGNPSGCDCYPVLSDNGVACNIVNHTGYFSWKGNLWLSIKEDGIIYNKYCPFEYCITASKQVDLQNNSETQCAFNRAGRLCGGCRENYSLAIGSSHCIHCPNNNNLALLIFFVAAGFLLIVFISALNLTVTQLSLIHI